MVNVEDNLVNIYFDAFTKALTLVVALACNNAFTEYFKNNPQLKSLGPWLYAFLITALVVFIMMALAKLRIQMKNWYGKLKKNIRDNMDDEEDDEPEGFDNFKTKNIDYTQF